MSTTEESRPSREELEARIADLEERNRDLARIAGQQLAQECHLQAVLRDYATPAGWTAAIAPRVIRFAAALPNNAESPGVIGASEYRHGDSNPGFRRERAAS